MRAAGARFQECLGFLQSKSPRLDFCKSPLSIPAVGFFLEIKPFPPVPVWFKLRRAAPGFFSSIAVTIFRCWCSCSSNGGFCMTFRNRPAPSRVPFRRQSHKGKKSQAASSPRRVGLFLLGCLCRSPEVALGWTTARARLTDAVLR
jgi:hypothetical protein